MIQFKNLALRRGVKLLFEEAQLQISSGERIGLIGDNGSGKTSLFALLRSELLPDRGDVEFPASWRIAHVAQHAPHSQRSATEFVIDGDVELRRLERALVEAEARHDGHVAGDLHAQLADHDAYTARSRAESLLLGLGFRNDQLDSVVDTFSGGWRMRLALAQTLMQPSELLLLDEPTNHLDLDAIVWLEDWLRKYRGAMIVISHDREFLDAVATAIVHIDAQRLKRYGGNYTAFEQERGMQMSMQQSAYERQQREVERLQAFITRFKAKATKARQAQSRVKALERMERIAPAHANAPLHFEFAPPDASPDPMLVLEQVTCGYGQRAILRDVNLAVRAGQRIGLLGANGQGKTTLIRTLVGELPPLAGHVRHAKGLAIGYFAQYEIENLRADDTPLEHLARTARAVDPTVRDQALRDHLGRFDFPGAMAVSPIGPLSGGEKARLALAAIVWKRPNLLLLDEPTNHLDLETRQALTMALAQFEGALIVVSHDRHLLRSTVDEMLLVADGQAAPYDGDLEDYRTWLLSCAGVAKMQNAGDLGGLPAGTNRKEQRREQAAARERVAKLRQPIEKQLARIEARVAKIEALKVAIRARLADESLYLTDRQSELAETVRQGYELDAELAELETQWLECQTALESVQ